MYDTQRMTHTPDSFVLCTRILLTIQHAQASLYIQNADNPGVEIKVWAETVIEPNGTHT